MRSQRKTVGGTSPKRVQFRSASSLSTKTQPGLKPARESTVNRIELSMPNSEKCRLQKIADTYGSLSLGNPSQPPCTARSLYHDEFQGFRAPPPAPIYPRACIRIDPGSKGDFISVSQATYALPSPGLKRRFMGPSKQETLQSTMPLADARGERFLARSEKQDRFMGYEVVYTSR